MSAAITEVVIAEAVIAEVASAVNANAMMLRIMIPPFPDDSRLRRALSRASDCKSTLSTPRLGGTQLRDASFNEDDDTNNWKWCTQATFVSSPTLSSGSTVGH